MESSTKGNVLTFTEAVTRLGVSPRTLRRWLNDGYFHPTGGRHKGKALKLLEHEVEQVRSLREDGTHPHQVRPDQVLAVTRSVVQRCQRVSLKAAQLEGLLLDGLEILFKVSGDREIYAYLRSEGRNPRRERRNQT